MTSHAGLIDHLIRTGSVTNERCISVLRHVDRRNYVGPKHDQSSRAYEDCPLALDEYATISAPHMHAYALEHLESNLQPGCSALDVGSGSGFLTVCMAYMCQPEGRVLGYESRKSLADASISNILKDDGILLGGNSLDIRCGDALSDIDPDVGLFDAIHIGAAAAAIPWPICRLLKTGGTLLVPIGANELQTLTSITAECKDGRKSFYAEDLIPVNFIRLTDPMDMMGVRA